MKSRLFTMRAHYVFLLSLMSVCYCQPSPDIDTNLAAEAPTPSEEYPRAVDLDEEGRYFLFWRLDEERIMFEVHVRTHGWVGFGLSNSGGMTRADVVVGWIKDGVTYFKDRHSIGNGRPLVDDQQDYKMHSSAETDDFTIFKFSRKLTTCDDNDYEIHGGTVRVIFAWSEDDPEDEDSFRYHGMTRGSRSVVFLDYAPSTKAYDDEHLQSFDVTNNLVNLTQELTYYHCRFVTLPKLDKKHHIVKFEPIIEKKNHGIVHHIIVYQCSGQPIDDEHGVGCWSGGMSDKRLNCAEVIYAWAVGQEINMLPKEAGISMNAPDDPLYYMIETHYNNPELLSGIVDSSGIRLYYTDQLRENDVGVLTLGNAITGLPLIIPPESDKMRLDTYCGADCTASVMPKDGIYAFASMLHSHLLGVSMWTKHVRDGTELPEIIRDDNYDFNYQAVRIFEKPVHILPGDDIITTCVYSTPGKTAPTFGGTGTDDEMCLNFLMYYPRMELQSCLSQVQDKKFLEDMVDLKSESCDAADDEATLWELLLCVASLTWDDEARDYAQDLIDQTKEYDQFCLKRGDRTYGSYEDVRRAARTPIKTPYIEESECIRNNTETSVSGHVNGDHVIVVLMNILVLISVVLNY